MLKDIIAALDADCTIAIEGKMPTFVTASVPLQQVFSNLINNAIEHSDRDDSRVTISVREQGNFYRFTVADNGQGIKPQHHEKIFGIFQSLTSKDDRESREIGLSIVKKAVENQDGKVEVKSQLGEGAAFSLTWKKRDSALSSSIPLRICRPKGYIEVYPLAGHFRSRVRSQGDWQTDY